MKKHLLTFALTLIATSMLTGCGYKGPLTLPTPADTVVSESTIHE